VSELQVETRRVQEITLIYPKGYINAHTVRLFEGEIQKAVEQKQFNIVVNCAGLSYIASAGLGAGTPRTATSHPVPTMPKRTRVRTTTPLLD
jgi:anti-anti-sigma factor